MTALTFPGPAGPIPLTPGLGGGGGSGGGGGGGDPVDDRVVSFGIQGTETPQVDLGGRADGTYLWVLGPGGTGTSGLYDVASGVVTAGDDLPVGSTVFCATFVHASLGELTNVAARRLTGGWYPMTSGYDSTVSDTVRVVARYRSTTTSAWDDTDGVAVAGDWSEGDRVLVEFDGDGATTYVRNAVDAGDDGPHWTSYEALTTDGSITVFEGALVLVPGEPVLQVSLGRLVPVAAGDPPLFVNPMVFFAIPEQMTEENVLMIAAGMYQSGLVGGIHDHDHYLLGAYNGEDPMIFASVMETPTIEPFDTRSKNGWFSRFHIKIVDITTFSTIIDQTPRWWFNGPDNLDGDTVVRPHYARLGNTSESVAPDGSEESPTIALVHSKGHLFLDATNAAENVLVQLENDSADTFSGIREWWVHRSDANDTATVRFDGVTIDGNVNMAIDVGAEVHVVWNGSGYQTTLA